MIFKRFYDPQLSQASYLVGCPASREAIVIDPNRLIEQYLEAAAEEGLRIVGVTETHIHADYLSGSRELARRAGSTLYLSDEGDDEWKYGYANEPNVKLICGGHAIRAGCVRLDVAHTPGHTPEHVSFILTDEASAPAPLGVFTGDFVFVGDVGRPDLLERAANYAGTMEKGARVLFASLSCFKQNPDAMMIWPGHGAGSACGKSLGGVPFSTLAYEKLANWAFKVSSQQEFVEAVLAGQPEPPAYFKEMKRLNRDGPPLLGGVRPPLRLSGAAILEFSPEQETLIDTRPFGEVASGYVPGSINIPLDSSFTNWAGWITPYDRPIFLIASGQEEADEAARHLALVGLDDVRGWFGKDGWRAYEIEHGTLPVAPQVGMAEAFKAASGGQGVLLDVRSASEYRSGHAPMAVHIPLGDLKGRSKEIARDKMIFAHCGGGTRSAIAASILRNAGFRNVANIPGGFYEYKELGLPVVFEKEE